MAADAAALRKAMKGWGTNEDGLIDVVGKFTSEMAVATSAAYKAEFDRDLIADIKSECSGDFEDVLVAMCSSSTEYDAAILKQAMAGLGTNEDSLSEVLCARSEAELKAISEHYQTAYDKPLLQSILGETTGTLEKVYTTLLGEGKRGEGDAEEDAKALYEAGEGKWGTNEDKFVEILCGTTAAYRDTVSAAYAKAYGKSLSAAIESEMGGAAKKALVLLADPIEMSFSAKLKASMQGAGTKDADLIRLIVSMREKPQFKGICKRFLEDNDKTVAAWVSSECGGDYKKMLLKILEVFG